MVLAAIDSNWCAPIGPDLDAFEAEVAELSGRRFGVALASGTAALHLALLELGVKAGDEVLVSTFTFVASAAAVTYCGATPVFIDSESESWNMSPELLAEELADRRRAGRPMPAAAMVVDLYGQCADYDRIVPILAEYEVPLIEDAAEAIGAALGERPAGSFGEAAVFSFNGNKLITSSGGGMLVTDDEHMAHRVRHLATQARERAPHYEHVEVGFNYRLSNLLAAFGRGQLVGLSDRIARRAEIRSLYVDVFADVDGVEFNPIVDGRTVNHWLTCITVDAERAGFSAEELRLHLEASDIESRPLWKPMHLQPVFVEAPARLDGTSDALFATGLCLPSGSGMDDTELRPALDQITSFLEVSGASSPAPSIVRSTS
nr:aminotransferase class I/II-fold pyridoxal phosphate-dependent enzyme [Rhabdothermincola salaria]